MTIEKFSCQANNFKQNYWKDRRFLVTCGQMSFSINKTELRKNMRSTTVIEGFVVKENRHVVYLTNIKL